MRTACGVWSLALLLGGCAEKSDDTGGTVLESDADGDGFAEADDCDDADSAINPDAEELCDEVDNNCDGAVDEGVTLAVYADTDGDGYGDASAAATTACAEGGGVVANNSDCDDGNAAFNPDAAEDDCTDPLDYNCDGTVAYADDDEDGWASCEDCDDGNDAINPDAGELCDGVDNDCDSATDEDAADAVTWYADLDGDGYGDTAAAQAACTQPSGYVAEGADCDDTAASIYPGATEVCDEADSDCDGVAAEAVVPAEYATITAAIDAGEPWICVAPGTYAELIDFGGADIVLESSQGPDVTVLDGAGSGPVVTFANLETPAAILRGFTITGGALGDSGLGAGIYISFADPTLEDLIIADNEITDTTGGSEGAGLYAEFSGFTLTDAVVSGNVLTGAGFGGGISLYASTVLLDHVTFDGNRIVYEFPWGGGLIASSSEVIILNSAFYSNEVDNDTGSQLTGSAIASYTSVTDLENVILAGNVSTDSTGSGVDYGAAYFSYNGDVSTLTNVTFAGNRTHASSLVYGQSMVSYLGTVTLKNVDFTDNGATSAAATIYSGDLGCVSGTITASYTNRYGTLATSIGAADCPSTGLTNMLAVDPLYADTSAADPASWDLTLGKGSSLIDAGDPGILDADGTTSDVGAYGGPGGADW